MRFTLNLSNNTYLQRFVGMKISNTLLFTAFVFLISTAAFSQPTDPDAPTPFGFIELLVGAGAVYGARRAHKRKT